MSPPRSHYRPDAVPDYGHRFHAGNVGDVWKHCALVEVLQQAAAVVPRVRYLDTHAGEGRYGLGPTGEWSEGIGRLWTADRAPHGGAVARYVELCRRLGAGGERPQSYPGSPLFARAVLGPTADLVLWERDETAFERLAAELRGDTRARLVNGDGLGDLVREIALAESRGDSVVVLIDPPYTQKADWTLVPDAFASAVRASTRACILLWYPVKSLTRPNAMITRLEAAGVAGAIGELVTTPLDQRRNRLNGSGVLVARPPAGALDALAAAAPVLGERCATQAGAWSFRMRAWTGSASPA